MTSTVLQIWKPTFSRNETLEKSTFHTHDAGISLFRVLTIQTPNTDKLLDVDYSSHIHAIYYRSINIHIIPCPNLIPFTS